MGRKIHIVSFSELDSYRQCPHKHELGYVQRWRSPRTGPALTKGILYHEVMETHYRWIRAMQIETGNTKDWRPESLDVECLEDLAEILPPLAAEIWPLLRPAVGEPDEVQDLIEWMYMGYLQMWGLDPKWEILATEHNAQVALPMPSGRASSTHFIKIKVDLIVKIPMPRGNRIFVVDHKSGQNLPTSKELEFDDQFGLYVWGLRQLGKKVFGALYNANRTQRNKSKPQELDTRLSRTLMYRTDEELDCVAAEAYADAVAAHKPGAVKPRHTNTDTCRWRCDYTEPCLASRKGVDEVEFLRSAGFVQDFTRH